MSTIYDSRAFVKKLMAAGMNEGQADTLANENLLLIAEHLATKDDLKALATREELASGLTTLRADIAKLQADLKAQENKLFIKLGGLMLALMTVMTAILGSLITLS